MRINRLTATFGRLENETLALAPGLNIIEAPNESGKSTWTAFLRVMLYGLNTRDRSPAADKRRYMPWSGSPMQGRMEVSASQGDLTIIRNTARANSPMGAFSAVYAGTELPVEGFSSATCGEALLGVPQEVYERSAYIRQAGIPIDQDAALERRIAALITTGEEDTSYTDAADRLRRQLTRRRYNKSGQLPQLEQGIAALRGTLDEIEALEADLIQDREQLDTLVEREKLLRDQLSLHDAADRALRAAQVEEARQSMEKAQAQADALVRLAGDLPAREELEVLRGTLNALDRDNQSLNSVRQRAQAAGERLEQAEEALAAHPLAGHTPEEAERLPLGGGPRPRLSPLLPCLSVLAGLALAAAVGMGTKNWIAALGSALGLIGVLLLAVAYPLRRRQARWDAEQAERLRRRQEDMAAYTILYKGALSAQSDCQAAQAAYDAVVSNRNASMAQVTERVRRFQPAASPGSARQAVEDALSRRSALDLALQDAKDARLRWELLSAQFPTAAPSAPVERPALSRQQLSDELESLAVRQAELRRRIHTAQGRMEALGDPAQLQLELSQRTELHDALQLEYDAIALASEVLSGANADLQNRFSPALGEKSAKIFTMLTQGKYNKVLLNRDMLPSAQEAGQILPRQASALSQGAADQLYLAVRLAICEMVLPPEQAAPILLDDALVTFDDARCAAALDYLVSLARERQVLLFTCQRRELEYLRQAHSVEYHAISL